MEIAEENCKIDLNKPTVANAGSWKADVGIKGKFEEIPAVTNVIVSRKYFFKTFPNSTNLWKIICIKISFSSRTNHLWI